MTRHQEINRNIRNFNKIFNQEAKFGYRVYYWEFKKKETSASYFHQYHCECSDVIFPYKKSLSDAQWRYLEKYCGKHNIEIVIDDPLQDAADAARPAQGKQAFNTGNNRLKGGSNDSLKLQDG
jgi:hypothetical protein